MNNAVEGLEGHRQRLREEFLEKGVEGMRERDVLELLLTYVIPRRDVQPLANRLLKAYGNLSKLLKAHPKELCQFDGVGERTAAFISLVGGIRTLRPDPKETLPLTNIYRAVNFCGELFENAANEEMYTVCLDAQKRVVHCDRIGTGVVNSVAVHPRTVVEIALRHGAVYVIMCHNHPSGMVYPSNDDKATTDSVDVALLSIGIELNDHIIVGSGIAYSIKRERVMELDPNWRETLKKLSEEEKANEL